MVRTVPPPTVCGPGGTVACCGMPAFAPLLHLAKFYLSFLFFPVLLSFHPIPSSLCSCWDPGLHSRPGAKCQVSPGLGCSRPHSHPQGSLLFSDAPPVPCCPLRVLLLCTGVHRSCVLELTRETIRAWTFLCGKVFQLQM